MVLISSALESNGQTYLKRVHRYSLSQDWRHMFLCVYAYSYYICVCVCQCVCVRECAHALLYVRIFLLGIQKGYFCWAWCDRGRAGQRTVLNRDRPVHCPPESDDRNRWLSERMSGKRNKLSCKEMKVWSQVNMQERKIWKTDRTEVSSGPFLMVTLATISYPTAVNW